MEIRRGGSEERCADRPGDGPSKEVRHRPAVTALSVTVMTNDMDIDCPLPEPEGWLKGTTTGPEQLDEDNTLGYTDLISSPLALSPERT
eukprot:3875702-Rhodomonas_salina.2